MKRDLAAIGEILIDFTPQGKTAERISLFQRNSGGAPANVAARYAILGGDAALVAKVGRDFFGDYLGGVLGQYRIDASGLMVDERTKTTLAFTALDENGEREFCFIRDPGADTLLDEKELPYALI